MSNLYVGVMSGTSLDGVDIALCEISTDSVNYSMQMNLSFLKNLKRVF
ncbi:MAG: anhydro-N-acetylmuramic acid kinase [Sulfurimonas sp.]|nr:anhydro-N-acetylmuramic acid kinase [Sulfurimonas sp.]